MLFFVTNANAQQAYEGTYFEVETPSAAWSITPVEVEFDGELVSLVKLTGGSKFSFNMNILSMKGMEDPKAFIEAQIASYDLLINAKNVSEITKTEFLGKDGMMITFVITGDGVDYEGDAIAVVNEGILYYFMCFGEENDSNVADLTSIVESFQVI